MHTNMSTGTEISIGGNDLTHSSRWYVTYTEPYAETMAARHIVDQGFKVFLPRRLRQIRHARRITDVKEAFFPRYMFVSLDLAADRWHRINTTRGVSRLLSSGERPVPVAKGVVEAMEAATGADGVLRPRELLKLGQTVRITSGLFADQIGTLQHVGSSGAVRVLLSMMERQVPVSVSETDIRPIR